MYDRDDYGFPVEDGFFAKVTRMTPNGYGFAMMDGRRGELFFHLNSERVVKKIDGICEWRHLQEPRTKPIEVGDEIAFDRIEGNRINYWCLRADFDQVYVVKRRPESVRYREFAFGYR